MNQDETAVAIGIFAKGPERAELTITHGNRLRLKHASETSATTLDLGEATVGRIDFLIECLRRLRIHAVEN